MLSDYNAERSDARPGALRVRARLDERTKKTPADDQRATGGLCDSLYLFSTIARIYFPLAWDTWELEENRVRFF